LGVNRHTFNRLLQDCGTVCSEQSRPLETKKDVDGFVRELNRREICRMFELKETVTLRKLRLWLKKNNDIDVSKATLWRVVRRAGLEYTRG
jgi:transposase